MLRYLSLEIFCYLFFFAEFLLHSFADVPRGTPFVTRKVLLCKVFHGGLGPSLISSRHCQLSFVPSLPRHFIITLKIAALYFSKNSEVANVETKWTVRRCWSGAPMPRGTGVFSPMISTIFSLCIRFSFWGEIIRKWPKGLRLLSRPEKGIERSIGSLWSVLRYECVHDGQSRSADCQGFVFW